MNISDLDVSKLTTKELMKLDWKVSWAVFFRLWWVYVIIIALGIGLLYFFNSDIWYKLKKEIRK